MLRSALLTAFILFCLQDFACGAELQFFTSAKSFLTQLDTEDLHNLYLGREKFIHQQKVQVVDYEAAQEIFLKSYLNKSPKNYAGLWRMMVFTGKSLAPKNFENENELFDYVSKNENVIAYTTSKIVPPNLKLIKILP